MFCFEKYVCIEEIEKMIQSALAKMRFLEMFVGRRFQNDLRQPEKPRRVSFVKKRQHIRQSRGNR